MRRDSKAWPLLLALGLGSATAVFIGSQAAAQKPAIEVAQAPAGAILAAASTSASDTKLKGPLDWNQWGGSPVRNNTPEGKNIPSEWEVGEFDRKTGEWKPETAQNIKWVARLGSQT
jgi:hypothetical protein